MVKIVPLSNVVPRWEYDCGGYPSSVRMAMSDGQVVTYRFEPQMPPPQIRQEPETETAYRPRHLKRTGGAGTPTDPRERTC